MSFVVKVDPNCMKATQKVELLQSALLWALSENASARKEGGRKWVFHDGGCGCCSGNIEPPEELRGVIIETLEADLSARRRS